MGAPTRFEIVASPALAAPAAVAASRPAALGRCARVSVPPEERDSAAEVMAGFMAAAAIFVSALALVVRPLPLSVAALTLGFVATAIGGRHQRLAMLAVAAGTAAFVLGMTIAVLTGNDLY